MKKVGLFLIIAVVVVLLVPVLMRGSGKPQEETKPLDLTIPPLVVSMDPENGATHVPSTLTELSVTFNQPMGSGFSWTGGGDQYPEGTGRPQWSTNMRTCTLPVRLKPNWNYRLGLNSPSHRNFRNADRVPLEPVVWRFSTGD